VKNFKKLRDALTPDPETGKSPVIPELGFNMGTYVAPVSDVFFDADYKAETDTQFKDKLDGCGTVACIAGWAWSLQNKRKVAQIDSLHDALVKMSKKPWKKLTDEDREAIDSASFKLEELTDRADFEVTDVATDWLGLTYQEADDLFFAGSGRGPRLKDVSLKKVVLPWLDEIISRGEYVWYRDLFDFDGKRINR
jgi:hypothetical protein